MRISNRYNSIPFLKVLVITLTLTLVLTLNVYGDAVYKSLMEASKNGKYYEPSMDELRDAERLFEHLFNGRVDEETKRLVHMLGLRMMELTSDGKRVVIIKEDNNKKRGRGFFIFRTGHHNDVAIQVPHAFTDTHTRRIGYKLFIDTDTHAIVFNTIKRDKADMAHIENSYFIAFATAFAKTHQRGYIVQLHGFLKDKRRTAKGRGTEIIISSGKSAPTPLTMRIYNCLKNSIDSKVSLYPYEARELGAKENSTGIALNRMGYDGFVHIEMSRELRNLLVNDKHKLEGLAKCIQ